MSNPPTEKKVTIEEALYRLRYLFIMVMAVPLIGMVTAIVLLYRMRVNNLIFFVGAIIFMMIIYISTIYLVVKRMMQLGKGIDSKKDTQNSI